MRFSQFQSSQLKPSKFQSFELSFSIQGEGLPILCVHGHPGSGKTMSIFTHHLCQRYRTIAPDLRGYGSSQTRQNFVMTDHLVDLTALLDRLQIAECVVLGWSLGGILAIELALKFPQRIKGLILVATAARPWGNHPPITWQDYLFTAIASLLNQLKPGWHWNIETFGKRSLYRYLIQQHTAIAYQYLAQEGFSAYLKTSAKATAALYSAMKQGYNRVSDLPQIQVPTLVLAGSEDRHITAASSLETAKQLPNCQTHCYEKTAHLFPWEIPAQVLADIDDWLDKTMG